jgi:hypothetical protein
MKRIVIYNTTTGEILGRISVEQDEHVENYPDRADIDETEFESQPEIYKRVSAGVLVSKAAVTISPSKTTINADGVDASVLTFTGLVANASLNIGGTIVVVTTGNPTLTITSDTPWVFNVWLVDALHVSNQVTITAA